MEAYEAVDIGRQAILMSLQISAPVLVVGMAVGLIVGLAQALTQIQEQTVTFVPKLVLMILALSLSLPWLLSRMIQYTQDLISNIPQTL
jgi:flagellar biosynthetic protein FliQ